MRQTKKKQADGAAGGGQPEANISLLLVRGIAMSDGPHRHAHQKGTLVSPGTHNSSSYCRIRITSNLPHTMIMHHSIHRDDFDFD